MEKGSFWDHFWGTKRARASGDGRLQERPLEELIAEHRNAVEERVAEEKLQKARWEELPLDEKYPTESAHIRRMTAELPDRIRDTLARGEVRCEEGDITHSSRLSFGVGGTVPRRALTELQAFKDFETFCKKHGLKWGISKGTTGGDNYQSYHHINIWF